MEIPRPRITALLKTASLALAAGLLISLARSAAADLPDIAFDPGNPFVPIVTAGPLDREWTWTCDDPSNDFPLSLRCRTYDFTAGDLGSGQEVLLTDDDCGVFAFDPAPTTYVYDIVGPIGDRKYGYAAQCQDSIGFSRTSFFYFWYDVGDPTVSIASGPPPITADPEAQLAFTCADSSYGYDFSGTGFQAFCTLSCGLFDADTSSVIVPHGPCDTASVTDAATLATHEFAGLPPGSYRAEVIGTDAAGNASQTAQFEWEVVTPVPSLTSLGRGLVVATMLAAAIRAVRSKG